MSRRTRTRAAWVALLAVGLWLLIMPPANAYLDPGTGSYLFQLLVGAFLAAVVAVKLFWRRIWGVLIRRSASSSREDSPSERES